MNRIAAALVLTLLAAASAACSGDDDDDDGGLPIHETFGAGAFTFSEACDSDDVEDDLFAFAPAAAGTLDVTLTWDSGLGATLQASLTDITDQIFVPIVGASSNNGLIELSGVVGADTDILLAIECVAGDIAFDGSGTAP